MNTDDVCSNVNRLAGSYVLWETVVKSTDSSRQSVDGSNGCDCAIAVEVLSPSFRDEVSACSWFEPNITRKWHWRIKTYFGTQYLNIHAGVQVMHQIYFLLDTAESELLAH